VVHKFDRIMRIRAGDVSAVGRNTMGVKVMEVEVDDVVASVGVIPAETMVESDASEETDTAESEAVADED
jgi:DNA gyrase subunit A